jgi:mono/diheme cytochrome c family protein
MKYVPLLCAGLLVAGCSGGSWPSEMVRQPAVQTLMAPRPAPEGSIPVGGVEHLDDRADDQDLVSPLGNAPTAVARGKALFAIRCVICHGDDGHGNGRLSEVFPPAPDLRYRTICARTDGFIYGTITAGGRAMPSLREGLTSRDRWALVAYVREIQSAGCVGNPAEQAPTPGGTP